MRKLFFSLAFLGICGVSMGQVQDNAVVPVSVTINSVMRLQVVSGGNIQFVFNTMAQFLSGIAATGRTTTTINVASSRAYNVTMTTSDATLIGTSSAGTIPLTLLRHLVGGTGSGTLLPTADLLASQTIVSAAPAAANQVYTIAWEAGTAACATKAHGQAPDTYVTNIYLTLAPN